MAETSSQAKVKVPLHLRLTAEDWEECCKMLNYAEMKVFIWIRASDPYGNRELKFSCSKLGEKLGLHKSSVSRALKSLDTKKLIEIDFEDVRVTQKVSNCRLTLLCKEANGSEQEQEEENESVAPAQRRLCERNAGCADATPDAPAQRPMHQRNYQHPESLPEKASSTPQNNKTYTDFIQTLSDSERESFEKFVREEWKKLTTRNGEPGEEIVSLERFLAREEDIKNWYQRFLNSSAGRAAKTKAIEQQYDWENDPRFMDWLHKAYCEGYPWTQENEVEREQRTAFLFWAQRTNAYAGRME